MTKFNDFSKCIVEDDCLKSDGDGIPDAAELLAGTNPRDPASVLRLSQRGDDRSVAEDWWRPIRRRNYKSRRSSSLVNTN